MNKLIPFFVLFFIFSLTSFSFAKDAVSSPSAEIVQYDLPYPGILPDNPLYFLKAVRDNLIRFFITDSLKKGEYDLLMSDKRLASSQKLLDEGKVDLSITTLSKSGNYFYSSIENIVKAKKEGQNANPLLDKLLTASKKHQEIISEMTRKASGKNKQAVLGLLERARDFQIKVEQNKPR